MDNLESFDISSFKKGSGIHIKKKNRGKFTEYCNGKVTKKCIDKAKKSGNKTLIKRATFADNARKWKHEKGVKVHKLNEPKSILDNDLTIKKLKKKRKLISYNQAGGYIVKQGDTLSEIARDNGITLQQLMQANKLTNDHIKIGQNLIIPNSDKIIGDTIDYGWKDPRDRGLYDKYKLSAYVDPGAGFGIGSYITNGLSYLGRDTSNSTKLSTELDREFFNRHLGFPRNYNLMPLTNVRFSGDYNEDGTPKRPNAEYVGLTNPTKRFIEKGIEKGYIKINKDGFWKVKKENRRNHKWTSGTSHLGSYSIRENNGSGIYDVYDTYDFDEGIANRMDGHQIEIRDTIHGANARPELYDKTFSTQKAEEIKQNKRKINEKVNKKSIVWNYIYG